MRWVVHAVGTVGAARPQWLYFKKMFIQFVVLLQCIFGALAGSVSRGVILGGVHTVLRAIASATGCGGASIVIVDDGHSSEQAR